MVLFSYTAPFVIQSQVFSAIEALPAQRTLLMERVIRLENQVTAIMENQNNLLARGILPTLRMVLILVVTSFYFPKS